LQESKVTQEAQPEIVIYTHPDCAYSAAAKMEYRRNRVKYTEVDVSKQQDKIPELLELTDGERITPVIVENGQVTIGFKGGY
jgi:glutaredoxin